VQALQVVGVRDRDLEDRPGRVGVDPLAGPQEGRELRLTALAAEQDRRVGEEAVRVGRRRRRLSLR
jgi:hypothetical protein